MTLRQLFPCLTDDNHEFTSPKTVDYNCIAWAAKNTERWWQPGVYWPIESSREDNGIGALVLAFQTLDYEECADGKLEPDFEKLALYGAGLMYTHAARQLADGKWTSKLGQLEDIVHDSPDDIAGSDYGEVVQNSPSMMKLPETPSDLQFKKTNGRPMSDRLSASVDESKLTGIFMLAQFLSRLLKFKLD